MDGQKAVDTGTHVWIALVISFFAYHETWSKDRETKITMTPKGGQVELTADEYDAAGFRLVRTYMMTQKECDAYLARMRAPKDSTNR